MYKWLNKMIEGKKYEVVEIDGVTYTGEYKGLANHPDWEDYVIFWEDGKSSGTLCYLEDIKTIKAV